MKEKTIIDLALRSWIVAIVSWTSTLMGLLSLFFGIGALFSLFPQSSIPMGLVGIISGILLLSLGWYSFLKPHRYQVFFSRLILLFWTSYFLWHIFMFDGGFPYHALVFFATFSALAFLLFGLKEGILWHIGLFVVESLIYFLTHTSFFSHGMAFFQITLSALFCTFAWLLGVSRSLLVQRFYFHPVTNLANRNYLIDFLQQKPVSWLMILNISNFKEFNDLFGYRIGDRILSEIASRLRLFGEKYRSLLICHLHSDEFAIAGEEKWDRSFLQSFCEELFVSVAEKPPSLPSLPPIRLLFHAGISDHRENLLGTADMAFRYAVAQGKFYAFYDESMYVIKSYEHNIQATLLLQDAIENNRIVPFFQPIVNLETGKIEKYECLARIVDRNGKTYEPKFFLFIAQRNQLYGAITRTMVKKCFEIFSKIDEDFSLNLSYQDLVDPDTLATIFSELATHPEVAVRCIFEIVEEMAIQDFHIVEEFIHQVKRYGARVALDDFGSGYSNFEYLVKLPFDYIKIDGTLIERLPDDPRYQAVVENIVNFSKKIGSKTVAEFVSSEKIHQQIKKTHINYGQGYYYGKPEHFPASPRDRHFS
ncbi:MAG: EAL domain-containing protein [Brevinematales bacterium]|nr:EAL domain-containing protein [Brevinematales bacterium]